MPDRQPSMDIREIISGIEGVAVNSTSTTNLPTNRRYKALKLFATGTDGVNPLVAADIVDGVQLLVNGVTMLDLTADQLRRIYLLNNKIAAGSVLDDSEIPIMFAEPARASVTDENITAFDLFGESSFTMKVKIKSGVTTPALSGVALFDYLRSDLNGKVVKQAIKRNVVGVNAPSGVYDITQIQVKNPVQRILLDGAQNITNVEVKADSVRVYESTSLQNTRFLADYGIDASQFKYPIVFDHNQQLFGGALRVKKDLVIRVTSAGAQTISAIVEERVSAFE